MNKLLKFAQICSVLNFIRVVNTTIGSLSMGVFYDKIDLGLSLLLLLILLLLSVGHPGFIQILSAVGPRRLGENINRWENFLLQINSPCYSS